MVAIMRRDKIRYIPKEVIRMQNKYGGALYLPRGSALYLPKGRGIDALFNFFNTNKDAIKSVTDTVSNVASAATSVAKLGTDTAKGIEEIKALRQRNMQLAQQPNQAITENALRNIVDNEVGIRDQSMKISVRAPKKGGAFFTA
jgi:hypothetical protein